MMSNLTVIDPRVAEFSALVNQGMNAWQQAGKILVKLIEADPDAERVILLDNPHLTSEILRTFERMGRRELYPFLAVDSSPGARRLALLPYDQQVQLYREKITIAVATADGPVERQKRVTDLTKAEAERAIGETGLRSAAEQRRLLPLRKERLGRGENIEVGDVAPDPNDVPSIEFNPSAPSAGELARLLQIAQAALVEARSALTMVHKRESRQERHITAALQAIGQLRFAITEGEL